jgi:predicted Zn-dependent protease
MKKKANQLTERNPDVTNQQLLILAGIFGSLIIGIIVIFWLLLNSLINWIPPEFEKQLGSLIVPFYEEKALASPTQDGLNQLLDRLETNWSSSQAQKRDYQVFYVAEPTVNAIAIPGDKIIIYEGLLQQMDSENELMMVLGHELGHFAHRDHLRSLGRSLLFKFILNYVFGNVSNVSTIVENIGNAQFSQAQESKADEFALNLLNKTYGQVAGATDFFVKLSAEKNRNWSFFNTHPAPQKRVQQLEKLIKKQGYQMGEKSPLPQELDLRLN